MKVLPVFLLVVVMLVSAAQAATPSHIISAKVMGPSSAQGAYSNYKAYCAKKRLSMQLVAYTAGKFHKVSLVSYYYADNSPIVLARFVYRGGGRWTASYNLTPCVSKRGGIARIGYGTDVIANAGTHSVKKRIVAKSVRIR